MTPPTPPAQHREALAREVLASHGVLHEDPLLAHAHVRAMLEFAALALPPEAERVECSDCARMVLTANKAGTGFLANCGRRLASIDQCRPQGCTPRPATSDPAERPGWAAGVIHEPGTDPDDPAAGIAGESGEVADFFDMLGPQEYGLETWPRGDDGQQTGDAQIAEVITYGGGEFATERAVLFALKVGRALALRPTQLSHTAEVEATLRRIAEQDEASMIVDPL